MVATGQSNGEEFTVAETTATPKQERIYECEMKWPFMVNGEKVLRWKRVPAQEAIDKKANPVRCTECHGAVIKFRKLVDHASAPHVEHKSRQDSENCRVGCYFKGTHRMSLFPVE